jgi:uncharacterized spore protein YtfJ
MKDQENDFIFKRTKLPGESMELIGRLFDITKPESVYSKPTEVGNYTVITAAELMVTMGAGYGSGGESTPADGEEEYGENISGFEGGGGGGGGFAVGRPVAAITIGPGGAQVNPIIDLTRIFIAFFATLVTIVMALNQVQRHEQK